MKEMALVAAFCLAGFWPGHKVWKEKKIVCEFPRRHVMIVPEKVCKKLGGHEVRPTVTPTIIPTRIPTPTRKPTPSPTIKPEVKIDQVLKHECSEGSSCFGWLTGVEVKGSNFSNDSRTKLSEGLNEYTGSYQGGDGSTTILTDFYNLPRCKFFDVEVAGSSGVVMVPSAVASVCP